MAEVPNSDWSEHQGGLEAQPLAANWVRLNQPVIHIFTHIELRMEIAVTRLTSLVPPPKGMRWVEVATLDREPLPTLFRKVIEQGLQALK